MLCNNKNQNDTKDNNNDSSLNIVDHHYSVPTLRLDITQKIKTWDTPSRLPGPIRRLMSVSTSLDDDNDDHDNDRADVDDADLDLNAETSFKGCPTPPVEMENAFDPQEIEEDEMIEMVNIWDMPIFDVADSSGNCILSRVSYISGTSI